MKAKPPLAERLRPQRIEDLAGQSHLLGPGKPLERALAKHKLYSMLFWGPPGVGKTTLARLIAQHFEVHFVALSAVTAGVKDVRQAAKIAQERWLDKQQTLVFLDEVHRFNKAQQDLLLPFVEDGRLILIGATTENPSFEINLALRSRMQLYRLHSLEKGEMDALLTRALSVPEGLPDLEVSQEAKEHLIAWADGDARRALNALELAASYAEAGSLSAEAVRRALSVKGLAFDKGGEHFYNLISALHKSVRGCDPDASLYWLARLLKGGADPNYVARRLVHMASEDIGLADPNALRLAVAAKEAVIFLGQPEGELALAECTVYLAIAPKSNAVYKAWSSVQKDAEVFASAEVPLHLRNAASKLMKSLGYGKGYHYYFDDPQKSFAQSYFPKAMLGKRYYQPGDEGWEIRVKDRLAAFEEAKTKAKKE